MKSKNLIHILIGIVCIGLLPRAQAACDSPDPGCPVGNLAEGYLSLASLTSGGAYNTGIGVYSLLSDTTGGFNTGVGAGTLFSNTTALNGTAVGTGALFSSNAANNTAVGSFALFTNTTGELNNAVGANSLLSNVDGSSNNALGESALLSNIHASGNTAVGDLALTNNDSTGANLGKDNTAVGAGSLSSNTDGDSNTAVGEGALDANTTGASNNAVGSSALGSHTTGSFNNAFGRFALGAEKFGATGNNAFGDLALFSLIDGSGNTAMGDGAGNPLAGGDGNVFIGESVGPAATSESDHTYIRNINTTTVSGGGTDTVTVDLTTGLLGHLSSSLRYKEDINPMNSASEALYRLKPVTYRYKKEIDRSQSPAFGLIAEEVAEVNPDLVARNAKGQPESVHYEMVNAMLLNEFLKEHRTVQEQQKEIDALRAELREQRALIQKVSDKVEFDKPATQTVLNNR
jgi:trimeric autotransporter adhesin